MKDLLYSEDHNFYIDGLKVSGVSSINGSYTIPNQDNSFLGYEGEPDYIQNGVGKANLSFERIMISSDKPITDLIKDTGFDGGIEYNGKVLNFESGYLTSYDVSFSVDSLPRSSVAIDVFGDMGSAVTAKTPVIKNEDIFIPASSGINLNCDGRSTNRVLSFSFSITPERQVFYKIGSIKPSEVCSKVPIRSSFSVELEVDDYETKDVYSYIKTGIHFKNIQVSLQDKCDDSRKIIYSFDKMNLNSESFNTNVDDNTKVTLSYSNSSMSPPLITYT